MKQPNKKAETIGNETYRNETNTNENTKNPHIPHFCLNQQDVSGLLEDGTRTQSRT